MATIALYNAVFHAGRAILFSDGIKEKSHYCLQKYLEAKSKKPDIINLDDIALFDSLRGIRQETQYNLIRVRFQQDFDELYNQSERFIEKASKIIHQANTTKKQPL